METRRSNFYSCLKAYRVYFQVITDVRYVLCIFVVVFSRPASSAIQATSSVSSCVRSLNYLIYWPLLQVSDSSWKSTRTVTMLIGSRLTRGILHSPTELPFQWYVLSDAHGPHSLIGARTLLTLQQLHFAGSMEHERVYETRNNGGFYTKVG